MDKENFTEMKVHRLVLDPNSNSPIVILQEEGTGVILPIWIGIFEAHSIAMKLEDIAPPRPMTHDLLSAAFEEIHGLVSRVEVVDLVDSTYFARIYFQLEEKHFSLDSRPSDAIALALRTISPIYVANHVLEQSKIVPDEMQGAEEDDDGDEWNRLLRNYQTPDPEKMN